MGADFTPIDLDGCWITAGCNFWEGQDISISADQQGQYRKWGTLIEIMSNVVYERILPSVNQAAFFSTPFSKTTPSMIFAMSR